MMLNEIITVSNSSDMLSATGRPQTLKEGLFTDDPEPCRKFFLSLLSQIGTGIPQVKTEETQTVNLKLTDGRLPDPAQEDNTFAGEPKGNKRKDGDVLRRLPSGYPGEICLLMGFLSVQNPQQVDLPAEAAFHVPGTENEEEIAYGLTVQPEELPVGRESRSERSGPPESFPSGTGSPAPPESVEIKASGMFQGERQPGMETVSQADLSGAGLVQAVPVKGFPGDLRQRAERSGSQEPFSSGTGSPAPSESVEIKASGMFQGERQPGMETVSQADLSGAGLVQAVPVKGFPGDLRQRAERSGSPEPFSSGTGSPAPSESVEIKASGMFQGERQPGMETVSQADLSGAGLVQAVPVKGFPGDLRRRAGRSDGLAVQPEELPMDRKSRSERSGSPKPFPSGTGSPAPPESVEIKVSGMFQGQRQQRDPLPSPDMVDFNLSAEKIKLAVNENAAFQHMDLVGPEKTPMDLKKDPDIRSQVVKEKPASFNSAGDSAGTGAITVNSAGTSVAGENETPNMFMAANHSGKIAESEEGSHFQSQAPEFGEPTVHFNRQGLVEKAPSVNLSSSEARPVNPPFQAEVLKQVVEKSAFTLKSGQSEIQIDLKPESLGHLRLHVSVEHQQVTVKILAENIQVKEMIERQSFLIKNELQHQGIKVDAVNVDMLLSGGSNFAYSQHEETAFRQARHEPAYGGVREKNRESEFKEPDSQGQANSGGEYLVDYFA